MPGRNDTQITTGGGALEALRSSERRNGGQRRLLILGVAALCLFAWQAFEYRREYAAGRENLRRRARDISNSFGVVMRSQGLFGFVSQVRLEAGLKEIAMSEDILGMAVLNQDGEPTAAAGEPVDLDATELVTVGERWRPGSVSFVNLIDLGTAWGPEEVEGTRTIVIADDMRAADGVRDSRSPGAGPPRRGGPADMLDPEDRERLETLMDGRILDESEAAEFIALIPGPPPGDRTRQALMTLLVNHPLDEQRLQASFEIVFLLGQAGDGVQEMRRRWMSGGQLDEEGIATVEALMHGAPLNKEDVETFVTAIPDRLLDPGRRGAIQALLLDEPLNDLRARAAVRVVLPEHPRPDRGRGRPPRRRFGRPPWLSEQDYEEIQRSRGAHWFVLSLSTDEFRTQLARNLRLRALVFLAGLVALASAGYAWRAFERSSGLKLRLVRAMDQNMHLRDMNIAAAGLVHETKNPLNVVRGLVQMMARDNAAPGPLRDTAVRVTEEVDRVTNRLNQFLEYSRPTEVRLAPVELTRVIEGVRHVLESDCEDKKVNIDVSGPDLSVEADPALLRQVVFNLLINAVRSVDGEGIVRVEVQRLDQGRAAFEVRDDGPGMPEEEREDIFRPYYTTRTDGSGLGLAIVRQIVLAHQWDITCDTAPEGGARFRVSGLRVS